MAPAAIGDAHSCGVAGAVGGGETVGWDAAAWAFAAWRRGDPSALDSLVRQLTPVLWQLVRAYGLSRQAAEDAVQATWLALIRNADSVRDPQAVWRWLTTTARRQAWRLRDQQGREDAVEPGELEDIGEPVSGPEGQVVADETAASLWRQVARLPERCRRLLRVIAFDDRPDYASLSRQLAIPVGSIGPTRGRCLDKLRRLLAEDPRWSDQ
jgi:RNA polymerase sigma factor (sigma-70 family)